MTLDEIDNGVVNVVVGFAPLRPAEFVTFRLQHRATDD
jgi:phage tail sheath protein FI